MVPKPTHNGCESWLPSMWTLGRHLSQYSSVVDVFEAPGTCKQLTPQITVACDGAVLRGAHILQPTNACTSLTCKQARVHYTATEQPTQA